MKNFKLFLAAVTAILLCAGHGVLYGAVEKIVCIVDDEIITQADVERMMAPILREYETAYKPFELEEKTDALRKDVINRLIEDRLLLHKAKQENIEVKDKEIKRDLRELRGRFKSDLEFQRALSLQGLAEKDVKEKFRNNAMIRKLIDRQIYYRITVTPAEVYRYYQEHREEFLTEKQYHLAALLIRIGQNRSAEQAKELAEDIVLRVSGGEDFQTLTTQLSDGPNAEQGGDLGYLKKSQLIPQLEAELAALIPGQMTPAIKTEAGIYLFKLLDVKGEHQEGLEEAQDKIRNILFQEKFREKYSQYITNLKNNAYISIR